MKNNNNIVVVAHKFLTQPDDDIISFLNDKKKDNVMHIRHSFSDAVDRKSYYSWYRQGSIYKEYASKDYKWFPEPLIYLKEMFFTFKWLVSSNMVWDVYIGMDGLCVSWGNILRFFTKVKRTIFWAIDFVPKNRFSSKFKNKIYHWININSYCKSDEMWDLSSSMVKAREEFLGIDISVYRSHKVVSYGVWTDRIKKYSYSECEQQTLVFMGHLLRKQGVQLVINIISMIIKSIPEFNFKIIGAGEYKEELIKLAEKLNVQAHCNFIGKIKDHRQLEKAIASSCLAIAPYIKKFDTWTVYTDPGKVKTYLACGVPVLLTDIPWNAEEIQDYKAGMIISEEQDEVVDTIISIMSNGILNQQYRDNAVEYAKRFNYSNIFEGLKL